MSAYSDMILATTGLVGYWRLGDASGNVAAAHGGLTGTATALTYGTAGAILGDADTACTFNGTTSKVAFTNPANLQLSSGSVEVWIKTANAGASYRGIVVKPLAYSLFLIDNALGFFDWGGGAERKSAVDPTNDAWRHVVLVFQSGVASGTQIYVDGVSIFTTTMAVSGQGSALGFGNSDNLQFYAGAMDEVAIYSAQLTPTQIAEHYDMGVNGPSSATRIIMPLSARRRRR